MRLARTDVAGSAGFIVYASSVVVTPIVLLRLAEELSFGLAEGGGMEAVRAGFLLAILLASGAAAARFGKRLPLALGAFVLAGGLFAYALAPSYAVALAAMVLVGLGGGILEALINPLVQDAHPGDSGRYLNVVNAFFSIGVLASVLVIGDLLTRGVSWRLLVAGVGALGVVSGVLFLAVVRSDRPARHRQTAAGNPGPGPVRVGAWHHARDILREPLFWLYSVAIFCGGGAEGGLTFWSASYIQLDFNALARAGGFGTAAFAGGMVLGRLLSGRFVPQGRLPALIVGSAVTGVAASLAAFAVGSLAGLFAVLFAAGLTIACFWPSIQSHAASVMSVDSTMLFILLSCAGIPGFGLTAWGMGLIAEAAGLRMSLLVIPVLLGFLVLAMLVAGRVTARRR